MCYAAVIHTTLNPVGGGERVALETIRVLKERVGCSVDLYVVEPTDWDRVRRLAGRVVLPDDEYPLLPTRLTMFGIYMRLVSWFRVALARKRYDIIINTHGDNMALPADIVYMHFPTHAIVHFQPESQKYFTSTLWRLYFEPYRQANEILKKGIHRSLVLTNSRFSAKVIERYVGARALVVYPPVDVDEFARAGAVPPEERRDVVVSCGRIEREKRHHLLAEAARELPDVEFLVIGSVTSVDGQRYLEELRELEKKTPNFKVLTDVPRQQQVELYSRAKVYVHAMTMEHFGIAVVEGMAAGLVPVVHRSGGPWTDIIAGGRYGYGFTEDDELPEAVEKALNNYDKMYDSVRRRARVFSRDTFAERIALIVEKMLAYGS